MKTSSKITLPMNRTGGYHIPVLCAEIVEMFAVSDTKKYIDATYGGGGHAKKIAEKGGRVLGIDRDEDAILYAQKETHTRISLVRGDFSELAQIAKREGYEGVDGILFDLGMSSHQIDLSGRGFSFRKHERLDMRMDDRSEQTAYDVLRVSSVHRLYEIFSLYAEELHAHSIAQAIVKSRHEKKDIRYTSDLTAIIRKVVGDGAQADMSCARIFQALRIVVNDEMHQLRIGMEQAKDLLGPGGKIAMISYHSLEDRMVKMTFREWEKEKHFVLTKKQPMMPTYEEKKENTRSRSAKLRVIQRI